MVEQSGDTPTPEEHPQADPHESEPDKTDDPFTLRDPGTELSKPEPTHVPLFEEDDEDELGLRSTHDKPLPPQPTRPALFDHDEDDHEPIRLVDEGDLTDVHDTAEQTPPPAKPARTLVPGFRSGLDNIAYLVLVLAAIVAPVQVAWQVGPAAVTAFDALLGVAFLLFLADVVARQAWRQIRWPRAAMWALVLLGGLSALMVYRRQAEAPAPASAVEAAPAAADNGEAMDAPAKKAEVSPTKAALKELLQWIEIFIVGFMAVLNLSWSRKRLMGLLAAAGLGVTGIVAYAAWQYLQPGIAAINVSATLESRHAYVAVLAMALPAFWAAVLFCPRWWAKAWGLVVTVVGLCTVLAGGPLLAALVGILVVSALKARGWVLVVLVVVVAGVAAPQLWSIRHTEPLYPRPNVALAMQSLAFHTPNPDQASKLVPSARYMEWQAVTNAYNYTERAETMNPLDQQALAQRMLVGAGLGNYQRELSAWRGALPKIARNDTEMNSQNVYLVIAFSAGLPALLALVWLVIGGAGNAIRRGFMLDDAGLAFVQFATCAAAVGFAVSGLFADMLVRGVPFYLVLVLAASRRAALLRSR